MRARRINPEAWQDRKQVGLSPLALLLNDRMLLACDSGGNFPYFCERMRSTLFPCSEVRTSELKRAAESLEKSGLWQRYEVAGESYIHVVDFQEEGGRITVACPAPLSKIDGGATVRDHARPSATKSRNVESPQIRASACAAPVSSGVCKSPTETKSLGVRKVFRGPGENNKHSPLAVGKGTGGGNGHPTHKPTEILRVLRSHGYDSEDTGYAVDAAVNIRLQSYSHYSALSAEKLPLLLDRWLRAKKKFIAKAAQPETYIPGAFCAWIREHVDDIKANRVKL